jgi:hypothetical protein
MFYIKTVWDRGAYLRKEGKIEIYMEIWVEGKSGFISLEDKDILRKGGELGEGERIRISGSGVNHD